MDNLPGMVYRCLNDRDWTTKFVSPGAQLLTGYEPEQLMAGRPTYNEIIYPEYRERIWNEVQAALAGRDRFQLEYRIHTVGGGEKWVWEQGYGVYDENGHLLALEGFVTDIVDRKQAEEKLRDSEERYRLVTQATNDIVWDWDLVTGDHWLNEKFLHDFGYRSDEIEPGIEAWSGRLHPQDRDRVIQGIYAVINGGGTQWSDEYRFRCADGTFMYIFDRGQVIRDAAGKAVRMIGAMQDITGRKQAEEKLQESESKYRVLTESLQDVVYRADLKTLQSTYVNQAIEKFYGYTPEEWQQTPRSGRKPYIPKTG